MKRCPICGRTYTDHPAISRADNKTEICPRCGINEAIDVYLNAFLVDKEKDESFCQKAKKLCRHYKGGKCRALSDVAKLMCKED